MTGGGCGQARADWAGGRLVIDLDAIAANWRLLRDRAAPARCAAVVKADAYGLGARAVAPRLERAGCRDFFVALLDEAAVLRACLAPDSRVFLLSGPLPGTEGDLLALGVLPVLNSLGQIEAWGRLARARGRALPAAIQLDTGMARFGLAPEEADALGAAPAVLDGIETVLVMSHLACADEPAHPMNAAQRDRFARLRRLLPPAPASLAASSGIFLGAEYHLDLVRPGAALYGVAPQRGQPNPMRGVVRLRGRVVQTRLIGPGATVGYGARFVADRPTRIATVAIGYADGFLRAGGGHGRAAIGDVAVPIIGRISMDCLALDVTALGDAPLGEGAEIELIGPHCPLDAVAEAAGTIGYEVLTALGSRYHREYLERSAGGGDGCG